MTTFKGNESKVALNDAFKVEAFTDVCLVGWQPLPHDHISICKLNVKTLKIQVKIYL